MASKHIVNHDLAMNGNKVTGLAAGSATGEAARYDELLLSLSSVAATELTIATGAVTATTQHHTLDTEGDAATDDLVTIATWTGWLIVRLANAARVVTLKHGTTANTITLPGAADLEMDATTEYLLHRASASDPWRLVGGAGAGSSAAADVSVAASPTNYTAGAATVEAHLIGIDTALGSVGGGGGGSPVSDNWIVDATLGSTTDAAATGIGAGSLSLPIADAYHVFGQFDWVSSSSSALKIEINGDTTASNYDTTFAYQQTTTITGYTNTSNRIGPSRGAATYKVTLTGLLTVNESDYAVFQWRLTHGTDLIAAGTTWRKQTHASITSVYIKSEGSGDFSTGSRLRICEARDVTGGGSTPSVAVYRGPYQGSITTGAYRTINLDSELSDPDSIAAVASNQVQIAAAGTYVMRVYLTLAGSSGGISAEARIYDTTNTAELAYRSHYSASAVPMEMSMETAPFTLAGAANIEVQVYPSGTAEAGGTTYDPTTRGTYLGTRVILEKVG